MQIKDILITRLYGIYNHKITLQPGGLTIIHGANGVGKTAVLKCLKYLFDWDIESLGKIPFNKCLVRLDNDAIISVKRSNVLKLEKDNTLPTSGPIEIEFIQDGKTLDTVYGVDAKILGFSDSIAESQPWLEKIRKGLWRDKRNGKLIGALELVEDYMPSKQKKRRSHSLFFEHIKNQIQIKLIDTNRLAGFTKDASNRATVLDCATDMVRQIKAVNAEYAKTAQELDQSFPHRLIMNANTLYAPNEVKDRLVAFEKRQETLSAIGLLATFQGPALPFDVGALSAAKLEAIGLFVHDSEKKLNAFNDLSNRCEALLKLIEGKFKNKRLNINREEGLSVVDTYGKPIPIDALSSGEQHEIVILYELLFRTPSNTLLLIDEPEISLHVAWQKTFIRDLRKISSIVGVECIVATHSPFIVGDNHELMISLDDGEHGE